MSVEKSILSLLEWQIFQHLSPPTTADNWRTSMSSAVKRADLSCVPWQFLHWLLTDSNITPGVNHPLVSQAVAQCVKAIVPLTRGLSPDSAVARAAHFAADHAAGKIGEGAVARAAALAADQAGRAAALAAALAADSARAAYFAANSASYGTAEDSGFDNSSYATAFASGAVDSVKAAYANSATAWPEMSRKLIELVEKAPRRRD